MFLAHGPISYILNEKIQKKKISNLSKHEHILIMVCSILFGILPDIDLALLSITDIPPFQHHLIFTHSIVFYISIWVLLNILIYILKKILNKESRKVFRDYLFNVIQWSFLIGVLSHFFADILFSYSRTLFPLQRQFTILGNIFKTNYFAGYIFSPSFALEIFFVGIFIYMVYKTYIKKTQVGTYLLYILISCTTIYFVFSIYMNLNIYNKAYHMQNNQRVLDADFDGILDRYDPDTDNDGVLNIYELDSTKAISFVKDISNGKYMVTNSDDIYGKAKYYFGAFGSYRLISQTYFEQNLPIEPVLEQYIRSKDILTSYDIQINYPNILYEYLTVNGESKQYEQGKYIGEIFFVLTESNIVNMGIVLDDDSFGIVLLGDTKLISHPMQDIEKEYINPEIKVVSILKQE